MRDEGLNAGILSMFRRSGKNLVVCNVNNKIRRRIPTLFLFGIESGIGSYVLLCNDDRF